MSARPRFGGDGRLRVPFWVSILRTGSSDGRIGDIVGEHGARDIDPFERTVDELLLAESFARFDFTRPRKAREWYLRHGVLDLYHLLGPDDIPLIGVTVDPQEEDDFHDQLEDVLEQQRLVRWHLLSLARLSQHRERAKPARDGWEPHEGWDPTWAQPALRAGPDAEVLWLGGRSDFEARITTEMQRYARYEDVPRRSPLSDYTLEDVTPRQFTEEWWPRAHAAWQRIEAEGIPLLWVPSLAWSLQWRWEYYGAGDAPTGWPGGKLSADWHGLLELERRLIEPYVRLAAVHVVDVDRERRPEDSIDVSPALPEWEQPITVRERRRWTSILPPIYLQLLEALRRISDGRAGAAFCRECTQPFLVLDARREYFCNERERARWSQRERRRRLAEPRPPKGTAR